MKKYDFKIAVCDDEKAALKIISSSVTGAFEGRDAGVVMSEFTDVKELYSSLKSGNVYDLIFLDIEMPKVDGVDFAYRMVSENIVPGDRIVFVTGVEERVFDTFKVNPFGFIRKNRFLGDLSALADRYLRYRDTHKEKLPSLIVSSSGCMYNIDIGNIKYIECIQRSQKIYFNDAREPLTISSTMAELENAVGCGGGGYGFLQGA